MLHISLFLLIKHNFFYYLDFVHVKKPSFYFYIIFFIVFCCSLLLFVFLVLCHCEITVSPNTDP